MASLVSIVEDLCICLSTFPTSSLYVALRCILPHSRNNIGEPLRSSSIPDLTRGTVDNVSGGLEVGSNGS